jgi:hypothetical protein
MLLTCYNRNLAKSLKKEDRMKVVLTTATFLTIIVIPALAQPHDLNMGRADKISYLGQYQSSGHHSYRYKHGHYYEPLRYPSDYGFDDYFRPFGGHYGGYYGGYFGSGNYFGSPYNPCGLGRSVLEGCRPYRDIRTHGSSDLSHGRINAH